MYIYYRKTVAVEVFTQESGGHATELLQRSTWKEKFTGHNLVFFIILFYNRHSLLFHQTI